jgi:5,6,7,8-tetrahydromethanopterin hydro-lyase
VQIGEGFAGDGANAAHTNTVLGRKDGPVGTAWATALATPREGHVPFVVVVQPNLPVKPMTLFVNKATVVAGADRHAMLTWGAAQAGVAAGVVDAVRAGIVRDDQVDDLLLIAAVWVNPDADDDASVFANNQTATVDALAAGRDALPSISTILDAGPPRNPYFLRAAPEQ